MPDQPTGFAPDDPTPKARPRKPDEWRTGSGGGGKVGLAVGTLLALLAVGGVLVAVLVFSWGKHPEPFVLSVPVGEYGPGWPANPWADADAARLVESVPAKDGKPGGAKDANFQSRQRLRDVLAWVSDKPTDLAGLPDATGRKVADQPLVLHITALAVVRGDTVYLLPADAKPNDPATWVRFDDVLDALADCPAKGKLLLLDVGRPTADPFGGTLRNDAPARIDKVLRDRLAAGRLGHAVITSCAPGEATVTADPDGCSAFALYLAEGLRGRADGYDGGPADDEVTVKELYQFVAHRVARYARNVHGTRQTPQLYAPTDPSFNFPLARVSAPRPASSTATPPDSYPLRDAWHVRDTAVASGSGRAWPDRLARLTAGLVAAEDQLARSDHADRAKRTSAAAVETWEKELAASGALDPAADIISKAVGDVGGYRLVVARRGAKPPPKDWDEALRPYLAALTAAKAEPAKADAAKADVAKNRDAWLAKAAADPAAAAEMVWVWAQGLPNPTQAQVLAAAEAYEEVAPTRPTYSETLLLRFLKGYSFASQQELYTYPAGAVVALLRAEHEAGLALAAGPDGFRLVKDRFDAAEKLRADGQRHLFAAGRVDQAREAEKTLSGAADKFGEVRQVVERWQAAQRKAATAATAVVDTLPAALNHDRPGFEAWLKAADAATDLADRLAGTGPTPDADAADRQAAALRATVDGAAADALLKRSPSRPADLAPWQAVMAAPLAPADARKAVWDAAREARKRWHDEARKADADDDVSGPPAQPPSIPDPQPGDPEAGLAGRRAKASAALLRLAGFAKAGELRSAADQTPGGDADRMQELAERLRAAWLAGLPKQFKEAAAAGRWAEAERVARATPPGVTPYLDPARPAAGDPPAALRLKEHVQAYREAAQAQFADDKPVRGQVREADLFYDRAATLAPR